MLEKAISQELITSAMSVTSGGLAIAMAKACVGGMLGCDISVTSMPESPNSAEVKLFSESQGRILVSVTPQNRAEFEKIIKNIPHTKLGEVKQNGKIVVKDSRNKIIDSNVKKLYTLYHSFSNTMK